MPTIEHDGIVELVRQHPSLVLDLLRYIGTFALPDKVKAELGSEDMTDVTPRANGSDRRKPGPQTYTADSVVIVTDAATGERLLAVVVEPQGKWAEEKGISWPVYATTARKANKCPRAVVIAVCWKQSEAEDCRKAIAVGHPGFVFIPIVISADNTPPLNNASPYLTLFNAVIGAVDLDTADGRTLAVKAITATGATGADHRSLCAVMLNVASDAANAHLRKLMARADDILRVLKTRRLRPTLAQRELIETSKNLAKLDAWFDRSLIAKTVEELFEEDEENEEC
jgi:hypothetical protein